MEKLLVSTKFTPEKFRNEVVSIDHKTSCGTMSTRFHKWLLRTQADTEIDIRRGKRHERERNKRNIQVIGCAARERE